MSEQRQPKFKFGYTVQRDDVLDPKPFIVGEIHSQYNAYFYGQQGASAATRWHEGILVLVKPKKTITMHRSFVKHNGGTYEDTGWSSEKYSVHPLFGSKVVATETRTVEVDE